MIRRHINNAAGVHTPMYLAKIAALVLIAAVASIALAQTPPITVPPHFDVPVEQNAPKLDGHPVTSVVVTQCNLVVAVYVTMADGRLLRFTSSSQVPAEKLLEMAYTATRSERIEVSCNDEQGAVGFEKHDPV